MSCASTVKVRSATRRFADRDRSCGRPYDRPYDGCTMLHVRKDLATSCRDTEPAASGRPYGAGVSCQSVGRSSYRQEPLLQCNTAGKFRGHCIFIATKRLAACFEALDQADAPCGRGPRNQR